MADILIRIIRAYRRNNWSLSVLSMLGATPPQCRFHPTCSYYAEASIKKNGALLGSIKSIYRIIRCNPLSKGGIDLP